MVELRIRSVAIQGFRSYQEDQVFRFPKEPGFYMLTGRNMAEPKLGANGAGKSALWDAICWCFFAKSVRGLRARDIANRHSEALTSVCVEVEVDGQLIGVTRTWNPNSLVLDEYGETKPIEQEELEARLGVDYEGFLYTTVFGQFSQLFFDLSATEKLNVMSKFLDLELWTQASKRAGEKLKTLKSTIAELDSRVAFLTGRSDTLASALVELKAESKRHTASVKKAREGIEFKILEAEEREVEEKKVLDRVTAKAEKAATDREDLERGLSNAMTQLERRQGAYQAGLRRLAVAESEWTRLRAENTEYAELSKNAVCPLCVQRIKRPHAVSVLADKDAAAQRAHEKYSGLLHEHHEVERVLASERRLQKETSLELVKADNQLKSLRAEQSQARERWRLTKSAIESYKKELLALGAEDPYRKQIERTERELAETAEELESKKADLEKANTRATALEYWVDRFKDLRLWVVEQALSELELYVNNALEQLGLVGYTIAFDIERQRADGSGVIRGFQVVITEPGSTTPVPWEAWSGGEAQRIRLAGALGIADLLRSRRGFRASLEVWDEPTTHLSQQGIEALLECLSSRAKILGLQVWLVDHRTLDAGEFDGVYTVFKTDEGSKFKLGRHERKQAASDQVLHLGGG